MDWLQTFTIIFSIAGFLYWIKTDLKADISRLDKDIKDMGTKVDADMRAQTARTDKLYEMFVEMQAKMDARFKEVDQKFYDLLKAQNPKTNP